MIPAALLMLLAASSVRSDVVLTQPSSMITQSGQSLSPTCKVSGYSLTSTYCTGWIRQPAGKALEWIALICYDGSTYYSDKLKNKFSISRDTSSNTVTLQGQNLQAGDTAVYYCARYMGWGAFDYWGNGTTVTVSSGESSAPTSIFALSQCGSDNGLVTLGCVMSGFLPPDSQKFKWKDPSGKYLTDFIQYPDIPKNGTYSKISQIRVQAADWEAKKTFTCEVDGAAAKTPGVTTAGVKKLDPIRLSDQLPVELTPPSSREIFLYNKAELQCITRDTESALNGTKVTWTVGGRDRSGSATIQRVQLENGLSGMISKLQVDLNEWFSGAEIECRVSDKHNKQVKGSPQKIMIKKGGADPEVLIYTLPEARDPNHESVVCEVRGSSLGDVYIMWRVNGGPYQEGKTGVVKQQNGSKSHVSILTVNSSGSDLTKFTCAVRHSGMKNYTSPKMADYSKRKYPECPVCDDK